MTVDRKKLEIAMARACINTGELTEKTQMPRSTIDNAIKGRGVRPATIGRIARALGCDPAELISEEVQL